MRLAAAARPLPSVATIGPSLAPRYSNLDSIWGTFVTGIVPQEQSLTDKAASRILKANPTSLPAQSGERPLLRLRLPRPSRLPILYVILGVLILVSVVPMYFYSAQVESINRERLITNERLL